jgi:hypothetical protein
MEKGNNLNSNLEMKKGIMANTRETENHDGVL